MLTTQQAIKKYGTPNETGAGYLVTLNLPYPMRIAWDTDSTVSRIRCHKDVADNFATKHQSKETEQQYYSK